MINSLKELDKVCVLDVESYGLYGNSFSYGIVVGDAKGTIEEEIYHYSFNSLRRARKPGKNEWIESNIIPHLGEPTCFTIKNQFYYDWMRLYGKYPNIVLAADCPVPVESNLLSLVFKESILFDNWMKYSPYPVIDITTLRLGLGLNPYFNRLENELPEHNALNDARQSYRGLLECLALITKVEK